MIWRSAAVTLLLTAGCSNGALDDSATRDANGSIVEAGSVTTSRLKVGDCYSNADAHTLQTVEGHPCHTPHDGQVFARTDSVRSGEWPGQESLAAEAFDQCLVFARRDISTVTTRADASDLELSAFVPDKSAWDDGDRSIVCLIETRGAALTESLILVVTS